MQQPSPNISSPSTGFLSPRASPLFANSVDQADPLCSSANAPNNYEYRDIGSTQFQTSDSDSLPDQKQAPPKQVAQAMERLGQAGRLIAQVRLGADRLLEALMMETICKQNDPHSDQARQLVISQEAAMRQCLDDLRVIGKKLEASGVLNVTLQRLQGIPSWGLHMPLVCPDGAVVAYAWKRQLAGQAAASAVDRTRLALKAFTDQKRRFFPHLEERLCGNDRNGELVSTKKFRSSLTGLVSNKKQDVADESYEQMTLSDVLKNLDTETPNMKIYTYQRLEWFKRDASLVAFRSNSSLDLTRQEHSQSLGKLPPRTGEHCSPGSAPLEHVAILEVLVPFAFRAVVSLTPAGSTTAESVAIFSPDEVGSNIHSRGVSVHNVYQRISEYADKALQYFLRTHQQASLDHLLHWLYEYQSLFTKRCSKCKRILAMDRTSAVWLPPVIRPYQQLHLNRNHSSQVAPNAKDQGPDSETAFHPDCYPEEFSL
eukprot:Gb_23745 [translate_table: standard]